MAGFVFNGGALRLLSGITDWDVDTIYARLVPTAAAALDIDADSMTGIGSAEASATAVVANPVGPVPDTVNDHVAFTSDNQVFPAAAVAIGECNRIVFFHFGTNDADSAPIAYCDITPVTPNGGDLTVTMDALGWFYAQQHA